MCKIISQTIPFSKKTELGLELRAEITELFGEDRVYFPSSSTLLVHFPVVNMENEKNEKHTIYDLYVRMSFCSNDFSFQGRRATMSKAEISNNFTHSHLSGGAESNGFAHFCRGEIMGNLINQFRRSSRYEHFMLFLHTLETYVSSESIDGGPYRFLKTVYSTTGSDYNRREEENYINVLKSYITKSHMKEIFFTNKEIFNFNVLDNRYIVESVDMNFLNVLPDFPIYSRNILKFSKHLNVSVSEEYLTNYPGRNFHFPNRRKLLFRGKEVEFKVIDNPAIIDIETENDLYKKELMNNLFVTALNKILNDRQSFDSNNLLIHLVKLKKQQQIKEQWVQQIPALTSVEKSYK